MITLQKLKIYKRYQGNIDAWARMATNKERLEMSDEDWYLIDSLIQDIILTENNLVESNFGKEIKNRMNLKCENENTMREIYKLARQMN